MQRTRIPIPARGATLTADLRGSGRTVVLLPSWSRGAADFAELARALAAAGYRAVALNPRGIEGSEGPVEGLTLSDLAADVAAVIEALGGAPAHLVGHAFGNRVARCLAADRPELVRSLVLLGAGGLVAPRPERMAALVRTLTEELDDGEWLAAMREAAFFAPVSDPMIWRRGWWPQVARVMAEAVRTPPREHWWAGGGAPILVVQGLDDGLAVPENGRALRAELGERVRLVELAGAGHALLPERPRALEAAVLDFLGGLDEEPQAV